MEDFADAVFVENLRGNLVDVFELERYFRDVESGQFVLIVIDAMYRLLPKDMDENDNGGMACAYNQIDRYAQRLKRAFALVHHSTKGLQGDKSVTDVGAGAGRQSRAADTHLILRPREQDGAVVLDAAVRSWTRSCRSACGGRSRCWSRLPTSTRPRSSAPRPDAGRGPTRQRPRSRPSRNGRRSGSPPSWPRTNRRPATILLGRDPAGPPEWLIGFTVVATIAAPIIFLLVWAFDAPIRVTAATRDTVTLSDVREAYFNARD